MKRITTLDKIAVAREVVSILEEVGPRFHRALNIDGFGVSFSPTGCDEGMVGMTLFNYIGDNDTRIVVDARVACDEVTFNKEVDRIKEMLREEMGDAELKELSRLTAKYGPASLQSTEV